MFTYISGDTEEMFAATDDAIYNITSVPSAYNIALVDEFDNIISDEFDNPILSIESTDGLDALTGQTGGDWSVLQYSNADGDAFLVGVNGADPAFLYDGSTFDTTTITFPALSTLTTADLSYVWIYKQRLWFIQKDSLDAWYLPVDQVGGELTRWPMGGIFVMGGTLQWGQAWSLDSGGSGGLSEQCVFTTTEGEVAAYQGLSPDVDQGWTKAGLYRIGKPLGKKAFMRAGGDLVIATSVGFISLASAANKDYAALGQNAVSYAIEDDWAQAIAERGDQDWRVTVWADGQMVLISPPQFEGENPETFVSNVNTGRWCKFRGWDITAMTVFDGKLFFGASNGTVLRGWDTGADEGLPYTWQCLPLFSDFEQPASQKTLKTARATTRSPAGLKVQVSGHVNFKAKFPAAPAIPLDTAGDLWDASVWNQATWGGRQSLTTTGDWVSVGGAGSDLSVGVQGSSGLPVPVDIEIIRLDVTYEVAGVGS
jgi:hypothetical protein